MPSGITHADVVRGKALATPQRWIMRRVESAHLQDAVIATRAMTVDYVVPRGPRGETPEHLPLVLLRKFPPVCNLDLRDESGDSVPILTRRENVILSGPAFFAALRFAIGKHADCHFKCCERIMAGSPREAREAVAELARALKQLPPEDTEQADYRRALLIRRLMVTGWAMAGHSVLWVPNADPPGTRRIIKFSYDGKIEIDSSLPVRLGVFLGLRSLRVGFETPHIRACRSYHFEVRVPEDLEIHGEQLRAVIHNERAPDGNMAGPQPPSTHVGNRHHRIFPRTWAVHRRAADGRGLRHPVFFESSRRDLHLYMNLRATVTKQSYGVFFRVRAGRGALLSFSVVAALVTSVMLWVGVALQDRLGEDASQAVPPILLLVPVILVVLVLRPQEHAFSTSLLAGTRYLLLSSGVLVTFAAGALAFVVGHPADSAGLGKIWTGCAVLASVIALIVTTGWIASFSGRGQAVGWLGMVMVACVGAIAYASATDWTSTIVLGLSAGVIPAAVCARIASVGREPPQAEQPYSTPDLRSSSARASDFDYGGA